jgi:hypothetical protein
MSVPEVIKRKNLVKAKFPIFGIWGALYNSTKLSFRMEYNNGIRVEIVSSPGSRVKGIK